MLYLKLLVIVQPGAADDLWGALRRPPREYCLGLLTYGTPLWQAPSLCFTLLRMFTCLKQAPVMYKTKSLLFLCAPLTHQPISVCQHCGLLFVLLNSPFLKEAEALIMS